MEGKDAQEGEDERSPQQRDLDEKDRTLIQRKRQEVGMHRPLVFTATPPHVLYDKMVKEVYV